MDNPFNPGNNAEIEGDLASLPDAVADALQAWRIATLEREKSEALLYARFRADGDKTVPEVKSLINASSERYMAVLDEIKAESQYQRLYEKLLAAKRLAGLRTAY